MSSKSIRPITVSNSWLRSAAITAELQRAGLLDRLSPDLDGGVAQQRITRGLEVLGTEPRDD